MLTHSESISKLGAALAGPENVGRFWSPIPGASRYLVSDSGEVVSFLKKKPRKLKPIWAGKYLAVQISHDNGEFRKRYIHRVVLEAFSGAAPAGMEARHLDGDRIHNVVENLGTSAKGIKNPQAKLTPAAVAEMRHLYALGGWTYKQLAVRFGVTTMTALRAVKGESWN